MENEKISFSSFKTKTYCAKTWVLIKAVTEKFKVMSIMALAYIPKELTDDYPTEIQKKMTRH